MITKKKRRHVILQSYNCDVEMFKTTFSNLKSVATINYHSCEGVKSHFLTIVFYYLTPLYIAALRLHFRAPSRQGLVNPHYYYTADENIKSWKGMCLPGREQFR